LGDGVSVEIHARWTPDLTASSQQQVCVKNSGTVAGGVQFHLIANYPQGVSGFTVDSFDIQEVTDAHQPWHYHQDGPLSGTPYNYPSYDICSSPPTGNLLWFVCPLNVPIMTFSFHNTTYTITANYHYTVPTGNPPPWSPTNPQFTRVSGTVSASFTFDNLIVQPDENTVGKILKWDPDYPANRDTTITYTISSAQKKNCQVTIDIYNLDAVYDSNGNPNPVFETTLNQLCPGTYTFTWDGTMNKVGMPPPTTAPRGLYTFDIKVQGACPYDTDCMRSQALKIAGHEVNPPTQESTQYEIKYLLQDSKKPSQAGVELYDVDFRSMLSLQGTTELSPTWNTLYLNETEVDMSDGGPYIFLFSAIDDHREMDKAHRRKPALEVNTKEHAHKWEEVHNMTPPTISLDREYVRATDKNKIIKITIAKKEDEDKCIITNPACSFPNGIAKNTMVVIAGSDGSDKGAGGDFGELNENGQFVAWNGWKNIPLVNDYTYIYYKCPENFTGIISLTFEFDDIPQANDPAKPARLNPIKTFDDNPVWSDPVKLTVWDFTIGEMTVEPSWHATIGQPIKIDPATDHKGNSLASRIYVYLVSSAEPEVCKNRTIQDILNDDSLSKDIPAQKREEPWEFFWDLQFSDPQDDFYIISSISYPPKRDIAISKAETVSAYIKIDCWDYGAYGYMVAQANIPNIGNVEAHVIGKPEKYYAQLPVDENNNYICDYWFGDKKKNGEPGGATDDDDDEPQWGGKGDGLSRYDEYRGFFANGVYTRTNPNKKDIFVCDYVGKGANLFRDKSGLEVNLNPLPNEQGRINLYDYTAHTYDQFYVKLVLADYKSIRDEFGNLWCGHTDYSLNQHTYSPTCEIDLQLTIEIARRLGIKEEEYIQREIAHELGHSVTHPKNDCPMPGCIMFQAVPGTDYCPSTKSLIMLRP